MQQNFIFGGTTGRSYDDLQNQRAIANKLLAQRSTPRNVGEGLDAIGKALLARSMRKRADAEEQRQRDEFTQQWGAALGGFGGSAGGYTSDPMQAMPTTEGQSPDMSAYANAIASIESAGSGDYNAVGPTHAKLGRALGRYQIMEANIGPWSREALGREVSPDEFMSNPQIQDAVFNHKFNGYVQKFGPEGAAQAWFAGPGGVGKTGRKDSLGTSVGEYGQKFTAALGGGQSARQPKNANMAQIAQLLQLSQSPYASEGKRAVANMYLGQFQAQQAQQMKQSDPLYQIQLQKAQQSMQPNQMDAINLEKAQIELNQMKNPERTILKGADGYQYYQDTGERVLPNVQMQQEWSDPFTGEDGKQYQRSNKTGQIKALGGGVTVNNNMGADKFNEAFAKGDAEALGLISEAGISANRNLGRIDQLESLLQESPSGFSAIAAQKAGEWGINTEGLDQVQAAQAIINSLVPEQRQPGSGPMSDADLNLFKQSLPRLINQPGGNQLIINTMRSIAEYDAAGAQIVQAVRSGNMTRAQAFEALQSRANPLAQLKGDARNTPAQRQEPEAPQMPQSFIDDLGSADEAAEVWQLLTPEERELWAR